MEHPPALLRVQQDGREALCLLSVFPQQCRCQGHQAGSGPVWPLQRQGQEGKTSVSNVALGDLFHI